VNFARTSQDPDTFYSADECIIDRERNRHIAFGVGIRRCAGSNPARIEMDVVLRVWFERPPEFELINSGAVT
jgi:cytochrome P450